MYNTYAGARRILGSISPGSYPKFCGLELIKSERFPKEWQGNAITLDFRANRVLRFEILEDGAGYTTKHHEFLRSTNITFRPIDVKLGPDGALYIADWSNPIIQHGEVDFRDPRRDRVHGRIWRVGYKGGKDVKAPELVKISEGDLLEQLLSSNGDTEKQARRLLVERYQQGDEAAKRRVRLALGNFETRYGGVTTAAFNKMNDAVLEALWMHQAIDWYQFTGTQNLLLRLLSPSAKAVVGRRQANFDLNKDHRARAAAVRILGAWGGNTPGIPSLAKPRLNAKIDRDGPTPMEALEKAVQDDHPRVRIEALRALARIPTARSAELALSVLDTPRSRGREPAADQTSRGTNGRSFTAAATELDPWLEYTLWLTINDLAEPWSAAVESGAWKIEGREKQLQYALKAIEPKLATRLMAKVVGDESLPRDGSGGMIELIGQAGGPAQLRKLYEQVLSNGFADEAAARALHWLNEAARLRNAKPSGDLSAITKLIDRADSAVRAPAAKLAGSWKLTSAAPTLSKMARDVNASPELRRAAIEGLRELGGDTAITSLRELTKENNDAVRRSAAAALGSADLNGSMQQIIGVLSSITKEEDALALWRSLLASRDSAGAFSPAIAKTNLPEVVARAGVRSARETGRTEPTLVMALNKAGGLSNPSELLTDDEIHGIAYNVTKGDPARGEIIYRKKELGCVMCHSIGGAGGKVGPDMTSLGASAPMTDYIVESVLLPNKKVKEGYNSVQITTKDDEDLVGNLVREDNEQVILRDATAKEVSIPKRNIASRKQGGSLMPMGIVDFLSPQERLDLYAFLAELGKPGPYDATKQNVARSWRLNTKVGTVNADEMLKSDLRGKDWMPLISTVGGTLPKEDVMVELEGKDSTVWLASRFQTANPGTAKFRVSGTHSPKAWIDGKPIGGDGELEVDLAAGQHTFFLKVTTSDIAGGIKLESNEATFLVE